jgi:hypothetical protein
MKVLDSSGWIEYFKEGENVAFFTPPIYDVANLLVPTIVMYEVFKYL